MTVASLKDKPLAWYDSSGDGRTDTFIAWNDTGWYSKSGNYVDYHENDSNIESNFNVDGILDKVKTIALSLAPGSWGYTTDAGGTTGEGSIFTGTGETYNPDEPGTFQAGEISFGQAGLTQADFEGKTPREIAELLFTRGLAPEGMTLDELEAQVVRDFPHAGGAAHQAGIDEEVYGFETDIERAKEDYGITETRAIEDIGIAAEGARSDIYGLQSQGAQKRREGMFGKGLGGGMSRLAQQDASQAMRASGQGILSGLASEVRGKRRGIADALLTRDRTVADATAGLYGVPGEEGGGTGMDDLGSGGIYGLGGSAYDDAEFNEGMNTFLANL